MSNNQQPCIELVSEARYGVSLKKPKDLKGIKQSFSLKFCGDVACPVFIASEDIWIKHNSWCGGKAWIRLANVANAERGHRAETLRQIWQQCIEFERYCMGDMNMFNDAMTTVWELNDSQAVLT